MHIALNLRRSCGVLSFILLGFVASSLSAQTPPAAKTKKPTISKEARSALKEARGVEKKAKGLKGDARTTALTLAARAYESVAARFAAEAGAAAAAWFQAAENWRRAKSLDAAAKAYGLAAKGDPGRFEERSWLQLAHIERQRQKIDRALALYQRVARRKSGTARTHQARVWVGRCFEQQKKLDLATDAYRQALSLTKKPRSAVDLCNRLALVLIKQGKLDQAGAAIRQAESVAAAGIAGKSKGAKSLKKALDRMSARKALQRARDKKTGAHRDAQDLERRK